MDIGYDMADSSSEEPRTPRGMEIVDNVPKADEKYFNDPVHGHFGLRPVSCAIIDGKPYQRLRKLKQLGFCYYVYPGASHNRFEHCLGVAHLSGKWTDELMRKNREPHEEIERCATLLEVAGLCHDLGHGPFSHVWEGAILPAMGVRDWHHEEMSTRLVEYAFETQNIYERFGLSKNDMRVVKQLIDGEKPTGRSTELYGVPAYLFDIVNNRTCGIDVDKLDYLQRDSLYTNVRVAAPYDRLLRFTKSGMDCIRFRLSERSNLGKVFQDRAMLHRDVYKHKAIELMVTDALKEVGHELHLAQRSQDVKRFLTLSDTILDHVQNTYESDTIPAQHAKHLLDRIETRDLYTMCGQMRIPEAYISAVRNGVPPAEIVSHQTVNGQVNLQPEDVHVDTVYIDRGLKNQDPLRKIQFYSERREEICDLDEEIRPLQWLWLRVYCKKKEHIAAVTNAFDAFGKSYRFGPDALTPERIDRRSRNDEMMSD